MCDVYTIDEPYKSLFELLPKTDNVGNCEKLYERLRIKNVEIRGGYYNEIIETITIEDFLREYKNYKDPVCYVKINSDEFKMIVSFY